MATNILVKRLEELYNIWDGLMLPKETAAMKVAAAKPNSKRIPSRSSLNRARLSKYDYERIRYFYDKYANGQDDDPIEVDNVCQGGRVYPIPVLLDGHHRVIAAYLACKEKIKCNYGGRLDLLRYLQGRRKTAPEY